ncbi:MAG: hypothetical protein Q9P01_21250 [Anaerolineae bacterium]|nr:hypothetical protein [Anaerolineae bacterium]MDQ7037271.1 hypothetical protein [Anaerolineae bacterium]
MPTKAQLQKQLDKVVNEKASLQEQLIESQRENIDLRKKIEEMTPSVPDDDVHWNKVSGGLTSVEALMSENLEVLRKLQNWILDFGDKYVKPYVHQKTYAEIMAHMMSGLPRKLAREELKAEFGDVFPEGKTVPFPPIDKNTTGASNKSTSPDDTPTQKRLLPD